MSTTLLSEYVPKKHILGALCARRRHGVGALYVLAWTAAPNREMGTGRRGTKRKEQERSRAPNT